MIDPSLERKLSKPDFDIIYIFDKTNKIPEKYASLTRRDHNIPILPWGDTA